MQSREEIKERNRQRKEEKASGKPMSDFEFNRLLMKYMLPFEFAKQLQQVCKVKDIEINPITAFNKITDYRIKIAKGKELKDDPRKKAYIDMSDCLLNFSEKKFRHTIPETYNCEEYKDKMVGITDYNGTICIPFKDCFIYSEIPEVCSQVMEIKTNSDGSYSGRLYLFPATSNLLQFSFEIKRHEEKDMWQIFMTMNKFQKPLGMPICNIGIMLQCFRLADEDFRNCITENNSDSPLTCLLSQHLKALVGTLTYLSSYKNKVLYKMSKEDNKYVYSERDNEYLQDYMKEQYPDYTYEKLTGWLVDGYWKILPKNEYGHNMEGKSIKGIDWVKPYSNIEGQKVNSGTQEASLVPNHAIQRAKERYNLDLTETDLQEMATMCIQGKATRLNIRDKF